MDGLVFVQVITFFSVSYLILRAMLERLDPSMEEAAHSLGAGKLHIFRTVTLPLLMPGMAGSFLLLFVESLADLGNPLFIAGNVTVLSAQIFLAVIGEYDYQKASALSLVLLLPTLVVFLVQRYYVNRRSYISVTGKPTGGLIVEKEALDPLAVHRAHLRLLPADPAALRGHHLRLLQPRPGGSTSRPPCAGGSRRSTRGIEAILDTTFLSALATPVAVLTGHGDRLPGGAQALQRQGDPGLCLEPGRGRPGHHPGHRLRAGLQHRRPGAGRVPVRRCWRCWR